MVGVANLLLRDGETTIKIKFAVSSGGGGRWGQRGKSSKNACFRGKRHDNKILKVQILLSRNVVVIAQAPNYTQSLQYGRDHWDAYCRAR